MNYLKAVMQNDEQLKIDELKNIISIGKKLNKDIRPDEKKLEILLGRQISTNSKTNKKLSENNIEKNQVKEKVVIKNEPENNILKMESLNIDTVNPIRSISTNENKIVVKFNKNYVKNDIKQISQKIASNYVYSFDIVGKYKYTIPTKLEINNIDNISVNDEKDSVNIKISNKENTKILLSKFKEILKRKDSKNILWNLIGLATPLIFALITIPLLINKIGLEKYGILTFAWALLGYASIFDIGITRSVIREIAIYKDSKEEVIKILSTSTLIILLLGVLAACLIILFNTQITNLLKVSTNIKEEFNLCLVIMS